MPLACGAPTYNFSCPLLTAAVNDESSGIIMYVALKLFFVTKEWYISM